MIRAVVAGVCAVGVVLALSSPQDSLAAQRRPAAVKQVQQAKPARAARKASAKPAPRAAAKAAPARKASARTASRAGAKAAPARRELARDKAAPVRKGRAGKASDAGRRPRAKSARAEQAQKVRRRMEARSASRAASRADRVRGSRWHPRRGFAVAAQEPSRAPRSARRRVFSLRDDGSDAAARGLNATTDPLYLRSSVALVVPANSNRPLLAKNADEKLPIASISKMMTALVVCEMNLPMDERLTVTEESMISPGVHSKLRLGDTLTRGAALHMALMYSDNRAAELLAHTAPGGYSRFIARMNAQAKLIGMTRTTFQDACGLNHANQATAWDIHHLLNAAAVHRLICDYSTEVNSEVAVGRRRVPLRTTNRLNADPNWHIVLQKTGYTSPAGRCVAMQVDFLGRPVNIVILDAPATRVRAADAQRIRDWYLHGGYNSKAPSRQHDSVAPRAGTGRTGLSALGHGHSRSGLLP